VQPLVLSHWPVAELLTHDALTTVANWRGYGSIEYRGTFYGQKAHSLRQFLSVPRLARQKFLLALAIDPGEARDVEALAANGWQQVDPGRVTATPGHYRQFIQGSWAEFGIAKSGYVASRCGWFSDRSICYLASGRPVLAQETGFSRFLPAGEGLLAFSTPDEVFAALEKLECNYVSHRRAARAIAQEYFASDRVLARLLQKVGIAP
jgi:hypothetical protein